MTKFTFNPASVFVLSGNKNGRDWEMTKFTLVLDLSEEFGVDSFLEIRECLVGNTKAGEIYVRMPSVKVEKATGNIDKYYAYANGEELRVAINRVISTQEFQKAVESAKEVRNQKRTNNEIPF